MSPSQPSAPHPTACSGRCAPSGKLGDVICQGDGILILRFHYGSFKLPNIFIILEMNWLLRGKGN